MRFYIEKRNKFLKISILLLIISLVLILKFNLETLGYFLLGIFASTMIITMECNMSAKVEEGKLLIDKLKKLRDICYEFHEFDTFSVDYFALHFEDKYKEFKNKLEYIFDLNDSLGNISYLNKKTKKDLDVIVEKVLNLEKDVYFIFENFEKQNNKMKIIYFMEFYKIIKKFDFKELKKMISGLGWKVDSREFYRDDFKENKEYIIKKMEYDTSIEIYNKKLELNNSIEYEALKNEFEKYMAK